MSVLLGIYKRVLSPFLAALLRPLGIEAQCRFHPTCSEYAEVAISQRGALRGVGLALRRLARCHPWSRGGVDPAPSHSDDVVVAHSHLLHGRDH